jgi:pilus assembly protein Flp/PilA
LRTNLCSIIRVYLEFYPVRTYRRSRRSWERGAGLVEYALIMVLVSVIVIGALTVVGNRVSLIYCDVATKLTNKRPLISVCSAPSVTIVLVNGSAAHTIRLHAEVVDDKGLGANIQSVKIYVNGSLHDTELLDWYCLGGGDQPCSDFTVTPGTTYTFHAVALDADNFTGDDTLVYTAP